MSIRINPRRPVSPQTFAYRVPDYDLEGWRFHFVFDAQDSNSARKNWHLGISSARVTEAPIIHRQATDTSWESVYSKLSEPAMTFQERGQEPVINICWRFISFLRLDWQKPVGAKFKDVTRIVRYSDNEEQMLYQEFGLDMCEGWYDTQSGRVKLRVDPGSIFYLGTRDGGERDEAGAYAFKRRFEALPDAQRVLTLHEAHSYPGNEWLMRPLHFLVRKRSDGRHVLYASFASDRPAVDAGHDLGPQVDSAFTVDTLDQGAPNAYVHYDTIAQGYWNSDFTALANLVYPNGQAQPEELRQIGQSMMFEAAYRRGTTGPAAQMLDAMAWSFHADPLVALIASDSDRHWLKVSPTFSSTPSWRFADEPIGRLEPHGSGSWYYPPGPSGALYAPDSMTTVPAALKSSLSQPVRIARIITGFQLYPLVSTFVVVDAIPTHYFKTSIESDRLKLTLCYTNRAGVETEVSSAETEWKVLSGSGRITRDGVFDAGNSRFTVIMAEQRHPTLWYWAVIILPLNLMSARDFVEQRTR